MMSPDTLQETVRILRAKQPFHPYTLVMNEGGRLEVDHPMALTYYNGVGVFIGPGGTLQMFNSESVNRVIGGLSDADQQQIRAA